ncbi:hypothetical protein RJ639_012713 [Escallonia herrerae]|uniref:Bifunctional inhibitor/plant lipid transfer protein/seed storage helical domain-containing protein n=1 Tax=Escallonia herrerae TaxID=1293975 RepID=A0AA88VMS4_9ASTE|nr:hypothetical protein RJ639_012713 [Escallonia herrerae]
MGAKVLMTLLLITSSWVSMVVPQWGAETCMSRLLPCKPFFPAPLTVTNACCAPLKKAISDDLQCICDGLNNNVIMESFNVSRDQALLLPKACGSKADTSVCNHHEYKKRSVLKGLTANASRCRSKAVELPGYHQKFGDRPLPLNWNQSISQYELPQGLYSPRFSADQSYVSSAKTARGTYGPTVPPGQCSVEFLAADCSKQVKH